MIPPGLAGRHVVVVPLRRGRRPDGTDLVVGLVVLVVVVVVGMVALGARRPRPLLAAAGKDGDEDADEEEEEDGEEDAGDDADPLGQPDGRDGDDEGVDVEHEGHALLIHQDAVLVNLELGGG